MNEKINIGVLMYTFNRTDDARINMEIIKNVWGKNDFLKDVKIVHTFNGEKEWWPEKYLEDDVLYLENPGHFAGAELLINEGMKFFSEKYSDIDYVVLLASDTWLVKPEYVESVIKNMKANKKFFATCPWGTTKKDNMWKMGMAIDFAIFDIKWARKFNLFPIRYIEFVNKYSELFYYNDDNIFLERVLAVRFKQSILSFTSLPSEQLLSKAADSYVYRMKEREPVHDERTFFGIKKGRKMFWPNIGLITNHDPLPKKSILKKYNLKLGLCANKLLNSKDLSYYNNGARSNSYIKDSKE